MVAAGASRRMGGTDKLMAPIGGRPLLAWTLDAVATSPVVDRLVLVTAPERVDEVAAARVAAGRRGPRSWAVARPARPVGGRRACAGSRRSIRADPERPVLVHDGARPLVSPALVTAVAEAVAAHGAAIPVLPVAETLKRVGEGLVLGTVDRIGARRRPRRPRALAAACCSMPGRCSRPTARPSSPTRPPCSRPVESSVHAIPGEPANLKVTLPDDLRRVEQALAPGGRAGRLRRTTATRSVPGHRSALGGVEIPGRAAPVRPLRRRRRAARRRGRAARRGGPRRPRPAVPGRRADAARRRQRSPAARGRGRVSRPPGSRRRPSTSWSSGPARASATGWTRCAPRSRRSSASSPGAVNVKASTGNLVGRRGRGPVDLGARDRHRAGGRHDDPPPATRCPARSARSSRSSPATSASTAAARPSTARPTSATSGRSCSPTCSSATCATAGCA